MNGKRNVVLDTETNGLELEDITKMWVLGYQFEDEEDVHTETDPQKIKEFFEQDFNFICHNIIDYDRPVIKKLLGVDIPLNKVVDTLGLSFYLNFRSKVHGLEYYGEQSGIPKVEVDDWLNGSIELYKHRVEEDVKINMWLWRKQKELLKELYEDESDIKRIVAYLNFKMYELQVQAEEKITLDLEFAQKNLDYLGGIAEEKKEQLQKAMPKVPIITKKSMPKKMYKADGSISGLGQKWIDFLKEQGIPETYEGTVEYVSGYSEPNASSVDQVKDWLFGLGWKPKLFKDGSKGKNTVPQVRDEDKNLCESVLELLDKEPAIEYLQGLSVVEHRMGYLKGFLNVAKNGKAIARASGFTKTLRLKHVKPFANLPQVSSDYGELVRGCIVAPEGMIIVGSDISSLEDNMKKINIYDYDREYVESMSDPSWDPHLDLGIKAGLVTEDEVALYKWYKGGKEGEVPESYKDYSEEGIKKLVGQIGDKRKILKTSNYALTYGCGIPKLMESGGIDKKTATALHKGFHDRNWAVQKYAEERIVKEVQGEKWIWNDIPKFWYPITAEKDRFSACNQSGGVRIMDGWMYNMMQRGIRPIYSYHDEIVTLCKPEDYEVVEKILRESMQLVNKQFKLPIEIVIDVQKGKRYSDVH